MAFLSRLRTRERVAELMDDPGIDPVEHRRALAALARINRVTDSAGVAVAELAQKESLPVLGGAELLQPLVLETRLAPGTYTVKYRVDFQDGSRPTEGVTELVVPQSQRTSTGPARGLAAVSNE